MFTFKQIILNENRVDFIKKISSVIDSSHDDFVDHRSGARIVDHFAEKADPSPEKLHTGRITNQHKKKHIYQEDAPIIHDTLPNFQKYASKLPHKDSNDQNWEVRKIAKERRRP